MRVTDFRRTKSCWGVLAVVCIIIASALPVRAQSIDTLRVESHSPKAALWRAAAFPGWGQVYNRQYLKLPFLYGALGSLVVNAIRLTDDYKLYRRAFQYKAFQEQVDSGKIEDNPRADFKSSYDLLVAEFGPISSRPLEAQRDNLRRNRDLSLVGLGLIYGISILDAFVSAHLLDFDVGENLAVHVVPAPGGMSISARFPLGR